MLMWVCLHHGGPKPQLSLVPFHSRLGIWEFSVLKRLPLCPRKRSSLANAQHIKASAVLWSTFARTLHLDLSVMAKQKIPCSVRILHSPTYGILNASSPTSKSKRNTRHVKINRWLDFACPLESFTGGKHTIQLDSSGTTLAPKDNSS